KSFASRYSAALMNQFNPETGHDAYYNVNSWSYDMSSNMYSIDMTAWWSGKPNAFADDCQSALTVSYHVARDGSSFSVGEPQINDCIRAGQNSDVIWDIFVNEMSK
ncbi:MAG TPA: hypothetical protein VGN64_08025, partial [Dyadobacter sp.]|nr:hypothetical protein [Dyadobacter sp.]